MMETNQSNSCDCTYAEPTTGLSSVLLVLKIYFEVIARARSSAENSIWDQIIIFVVFVTDTQLHLYSQLLKYKTDS